MCVLVFKLNMYSDYSSNLLATHLKKPQLIVFCAFFFFFLQTRWGCIALWIQFFECDILYKHTQTYRVYCNLIVIMNH